MYAVIEVGAKQYLVKKDEILEVELQDAPEGTEIAIGKVLIASKDDDLRLGQPYLKGAEVSALVLKHIKGEKVVSFKYRRRKSSKWKKGHRQLLTRLQIKEIKLG